MKRRRNALGALAGGAASTCGLVPGLAAGLASGLASSLAGAQPKSSSAGRSAAPSAGRSAAPSATDPAPRLYRFTRTPLVSEDGERRYRLLVGVPRRAPSKDGHPLALLLDGNAAMALLDEPLLGRLDATGRPPVIAALGYETERRFDPPARTVDYTPARPEGAAATRDPARGGRAGGADAFLALIESRVKPKLRETARLDTGRETIWGHGYGGLFVLHLLFTRPAAFSRYVAADPTLWWQDGLILKTEAAAAKLPPRETRLFVMTGRGADRGRSDPAEAGGEEPAPAKLVEARRAVAPEETGRLVERQTRRPGLVVSHQVFQGMGHAALFAASLEPALRFAARH